MRKHRFVWVVMAIAAAGAIGPAVALAGKPVTSGQQTLQVTARLDPAKAGSRNVTLNAVIKYTNPNGKQQPPYNGKTLTFSGPFGLNPAAVPACKESAVVKAGGKTSGCSSDTMVGHGTVVVNAYPTVKTLVSGTATIYNGINDKGYDGQPKGSRAALVYVKTTIGINGTYPFYIHKTSKGTSLVDYGTKPKKPGVQPGSFTIHKISLSLAAGTAHKPYLSDPTSCGGSWLFSFAIKNYFNQPSVTANDRDPCTK